MKRTFTDQLGRDIQINFPPKRIISLVPSQTELLFDLGLNKEIVGITKFCIHPESKVKGRTRIGGTKTLNIELIKKLNPDIIIGNKEENSRSDIDLLMGEHPVWMSDVNTLEEAKEMIGRFGEFLDRQPESGYLNHLIQSGFADLQQLATENITRKKVAYLIWKDPYMFAGSSTFIDSMLSVAGFINVVQSPRYPELSISELASLAPDVLLLSTEPYPFKEKHISEIKLLLPNIDMLLVDGEMFSWYGSRLLRSIEYLFHLQKAIS
jgi:ABC-type Fe3+-hydroxamate transport system substrate-binding protein